MGEAADRRGPAAGLRALARLRRQPLGALRRRPREPRAQESVRGAVTPGAAALRRRPAAGPLGHQVAAKLQRLLGGGRHCQLLQRQGHGGGHGLQHAQGHDEVDARRADRGHLLPVHHVRHLPSFYGALQVRGQDHGLPRRRRRARLRREGQAVHLDDGPVRRRLPPRRARLLFDGPVVGDGRPRHHGPPHGEAALLRPRRPGLRQRDGPI
mmetsp:Transcript_22782/g.78409  ORF Transcript_22782/g.78409 Transcript_22782/m.78409 type:complete len:211 (+) Transcript_22782:1455-2087(+)